jgi:hypothetical protein
MIGSTGCLRGGVGKTTIVCGLASVLTGDVKETRQVSRYLIPTVAITRNAQVEASSG